MKNRWLDRSLFISPYYYTLCLTEKAFHAELRKLKLPRSEYPPFMKTTHADATAHFFESNIGNLCCIVTINSKPDRPSSSVCGLLIHEATHLWQKIKETIGEQYPSSEFEAYAIQSLSQRLIEEYERQTKCPTS
jgi:hypothetical protein